MTVNCSFLYPLLCSIEKSRFVSLPALSLFPPSLFSPSLFHSTCPAGLCSSQVRASCTYDIVISPREVRRGGRVARVNALSRGAWLHWDITAALNRDPNVGPTTGDDVHRCDLRKIAALDTLVNNRPPSPRRPSRPLTPHYAIRDWETRLRGRQCSPPLEASISLESHGGKGGYNVPTNCVSEGRTGAKSYLFRDIYI